MTYISFFDNNFPLDEEQPAGVFQYGFINEIERTLTTPWSNNQQTESAGGVEGGAGNPAIMVPREFERSMTHEKVTFSRQTWSGLQQMI